MTESDDNRRQSPAAGEPARRRPIWVPAAKLAMFAAVMFLVVRELVRRLRELDLPGGQIRPGWLAAAFALHLCGTALYSLILQKSLGRFGRPPAWHVTAGIAWLARLGKYVPGKVASVIGATWMLSQRGFPLRAAVSGLFLHQGLWIVACFLASVPLTLWGPVRDSLPLAWLWCAAGIVVGAACLHPRIFLRIEGLMLRRLGRFDQPPEVSLRGLLPPLVLQVGSLIAAGLTMWLTCRTVVPVDISALPMLTSATAMALALGFLAVFVPAGLGVREGILLALLGPLVGAGPSAIVVLLSRVTQTVVELLLALCGLVILRRNLPPSNVEEGPSA